MGGFWARIPEFWRGVLASITGGLILTGILVILRIGSSSFREWARKRRFALQAIREQLFAQNAGTRIEANLQIMFNVMKWLIIGSLLWAISEVVYLLFAVEALYWARLAARFLGAALVIVALRWVLVYERPHMPVLGELEQILTSSVFRLYFNPPRNSKVITFEVDGSVGEGRNANEYTWRTQDNMLELVQEDGDVHSRFAYDPRTASFLHTNDPDTHSIRNQYIVSVRQRDLISQAEDSA